MSDIRKPIHDKLITDIGSLTASTSTGNIFVSTKKIFFTIPTQLPVCRIIPTEVSNDVIGDTTDVRRLGWEVGIYELIENSGQETESIVKIDRLSYIEDAVLDYLQKIPNNLEFSISGIHVVDILVEPGIYNYESSEAGVIVYLSINFTTGVEITTKLL